MVMYQGVVSLIYEWLFIVVITGRSRDPLAASSVKAMLAINGKCKFKEKIAMPQEIMEFYYLVTHGSFI